MAAFAATMHQVAPNRWVFEPPDVAPMKGRCPSCQRSVAVLRPTSITFPGGDYIVRGACEQCGTQITLVLESER